MPGRWTYDVFVAPITGQRYQDTIVIATNNPTAVIINPANGPNPGIIHVVIP